MNDPHDEALARLEALAKLMDVPGTKTRIGFDGLIGLIPGVGDVVFGLISSYLIWAARRFEVGDGSHDRKHASRYRGRCDPLRRRCL
jgi:hypothetical protein